MPLASASAPTERSPRRLSAIQACRRSKRSSPCCRASVALNCAWPPGRLRKTTSWRATAKRELAAEILLDQRQRQVDAGGDAGRGPDIAVLDEDRIGLQLHLGKALGELGAAAPMRHRAPSVEQAGGRQQERAAAHRGDAPRGLRARLDPADQRASRRRDGRPSRRRRSACPRRRAAPAAAASRGRGRRMTVASAPSATTTGS